MADEPTTVSEVVVVAPKKRAAPPGGTAIYKPQISVVLKKNISRKTAGGDVAASERFKASKREIDLTPFLGEGSSVTVTRSVRQPAGMFSISFPDQMEPEQMESIYGLIEPMDVIEIRMARDVSQTDDGVEKRMPLMMRGFVGECRRVMAMGENGARRSVIISGHDYGKALQIMRVIYLPGMVLGQDLLSSLKLFLNYGVGVEAEQAAGDFVTDVVDKVVNPFLAKMRDAASGGVESPIMDLGVDVSVTEGVISPFGAQEWPGGTIYELLSHFGDVGPWNELYVEDREDGPFLVYRPTPFRTIDGEMIQDGADLETVDVYNSDLIQLDVLRTDASVANYYWVDAPRFALIEAPILRLGAQEGAMKPEPYLKDYKNSSPELYGVRMMQADTQQGARNDGQAEAEFEAGEGVSVALVNEKRRVLIENNKDNVVLEAGDMIIKGNERLQAGYEVRMNAGRFVWKAYAHQVTHQFTPFTGAFVTSVQFDRGTSFVERIQQGSGASSPYLAESNRRGAYGA